MTNSSKEQGKITTVVSTLDQVVSTPCSKPKTKTCKTGQVVSTLVQVVSTQCIKNKAKRSSSVDTSPGQVLVTLAWSHLTPRVLHHYLKKGRMIGVSELAQ
ncbi:hypothetical protein Taro_026084 [Colocasia esculenta]|uniref:Uncharacterized protein n=1 Tax=Colocasia esculenta TaxID=4460 RepID=A0A843VE69_COLES|nr:hypothetical protein [Colocasia esculenta]